MTLTIQMLGPRRAALCRCCGHKRLVQRFLRETEWTPSFTFDICTVCLIDALRYACEGVRKAKKERPVVKPRSRTGEPVPHGWMGL